jgi:phage baseplate assembly protein W
MTPVIQTSTIAPPVNRLAELGANWRLQFLQPDGLPLTMSSFEAIDFGGISYKEIFQNVKTILATPLYSAALERTLGVDQSIVDRPIGNAAHVTVAILTAVAQWEPRCLIMNIDFDMSDALNGHLVVKLQLDVKNVIYGTNTTYPATSISAPMPENVVQALPPLMEPIVIEGPAGAKGDTGPAGERGSLWYSGVGPPPTIAGAKEQDMYLDTASGDISQLQSSPTGKKAPKPPPGKKGPTGDQGPQGRRATKWWFGENDPGDIAGALESDLYLNTANGDVWQMQGLTWRKVTNAERVD